MNESMLRRIHVHQNTRCTHLIGLIGPRVYTNLLRQPRINLIEREPNNHLATPNEGSIVILTEETDLEGGCSILFKILVTNLHSSQKSYLCQFSKKKLIIIFILLKKVQGNTLPEEATARATFNELRNRMECKKCHQNRAVVMVLPCKHHSLCPNCHDNATECAICNGPIDNKIGALFG